MKLTRRATPVVLATALAMLLTACAQSDRSNNNSSSSAGGATDGTFTFGAAGAPKLFDPFYATDGETFRVSRQIFDTLVGIKPGTADLAPGLATSWEPSSDGLKWTFTLRDGVKFTDGTPFNADAVCKNFERMFDQNPAGQVAAEYWQSNFVGFKDGKDPSLYKGCEAKDPTHAVIEVSRVTSKFPAVLALTSFSMQSPTAMDKGKANDVKAQGEGFIYPDYAMKDPVGTGAFKLQKYDEANKTVTLVRNDDYWGDKAKVKTLVFKIIPDESTRRQELQAGSIDGYDLPNPVDWKGLKDAGNQLLVRPAFNILYLAFDPDANPKLKDLRVRQAIAYSLNRDQLVKTQLPEGAKTAIEFMPDTVTGYNTDVMKYDYNPDKAKQLLKEAGAEGMTLNFWYPTEVTRPYMPAPQKIHDALKNDMEAVGIKVTTTAKPWNGGYLDAVDAGTPQAWLLGWTGDYNAADNFIGTFFMDPKNNFHTHSYPWGKALSDALIKADGVVDEGQRDAAYKQINADIMSKYLPGVPISHSPPAIVVSKNVKGLVASPLTAEEFNTVSVSK
jgi:peptide/nickel transport system substrate-binding protein